MWTWFRHHIRSKLNPHAASFLCFQQETWCCPCFQIRVLPVHFHSRLNASQEMYTQLVLTQITFLLDASNQVLPPNLASRPHSAETEHLVDRTSPTHAHGPPGSTSHASHKLCRLHLVSWPPSIPILNLATINFRPRQSEFGWARSP